MLFRRNWYLYFTCSNFPEKIAGELTFFQRKKYLAVKLLVVISITGQIEILQELSCTFPVTSVEEVLLSTAPSTKVL